MSQAAASLLAILGVVLALFWLAPDVPLLGFAAVLVAISLRAPAEWAGSHIGIRRWIAVLALLATLLLVALLAVWYAIEPLTEQAGQLAQELPRSLGVLRDRIGSTPFGAWLVPRLRLESLMSSDGAVAQAATVVSGTVSAIGNAAIVLLMGVYLALSPYAYLRGLRLLTDPALDDAVRHAFAEAGEVLRGWLLGQSIAMIVTGLLTWVGLTMLGVPLAGVLAAITAILGFIPVLGPVIAAVPAMLLALTLSPTMVLYVALLFLAIQTIEGNILTPMVQSAAAGLPPALLLLAQILMGAQFGLLGVALAAPLAAVGLVFMRRAYVEGWLGRKPDPRGSRKAAAE